MNFVHRVYFPPPILSISVIVLGSLIGNNRVLCFGYDTVQDNLRTTFVNGRKLFIPAEQPPGQQVFFTQPQQQRSQQQPTITVMPPQQQFPQQQPQVQNPQIIQITASNVGDDSTKRRPSIKWNPKGIERQKVEKSQNQKMSRLIAAPRTDLGYYYAADDARKAENKSATATVGRDKDDESKTSKHANKDKELGKASVFQHRNPNVDLVDVKIGVEKTPPVFATQSTEDLAEPPPSPSMTDEPLLVPLIDVQKNDESQEKKERKKKKKKKGKNENKKPLVIKLTNGTTDSNTVTKPALSGEPFTEYVTPPLGSPTGTDETTINRYSPPMTPTEHSISTMLRCQDLLTGALLPSATTCRNTRSDKVCAYLFADVNRKSGRRDVKCNLQGIEDVAESCRKTCGICCEDINYSCEDDSNGLIDCSKQLDKCHIPKWFGVLSRFCAGSCGLCALTKCRDYDNTCRVRKALCLEESTIDYMRDNCARTCGFCFVTDLVDREEEETANIAGMFSSLAGTAAPAAKTRYGRPTAGGHGNHAQRLIERPPKMGGGSIPTNGRTTTPECIDRELNCAASEDMCGSPLYAEYMIKFCTRTCLKCEPPGGATAAALATDEMLRRFQSSPPVGGELPMMEPPIAGTGTETTASPLSYNNGEAQYGELFESVTAASAGQRQYGTVLELLSDGGDDMTTPAPALRFADAPAVNTAAASVAELLRADGAVQLANWWQDAEPPATSVLNGALKRSCEDKHPKCASWTANGLCTSSRFTVDDRLQLCPWSCKLCALLS